MPKNYCIMQIWAESGKSALPICNYSQILYQFLTFTQNLKRSPYDFIFYHRRPLYCLIYRDFSTGFRRRLIRFRSPFPLTAVYSAAGASDSEAVSSVFASPEVSSASGASVAGAASASFAASSFASASAASFASAAASVTVV